MELSAAHQVFVREARVGRLATVDEHGRPHVVPVCFVYLRGIVYSVLDAKPKRVAPSRLRRVRNLQRNPQVQLLIDRYAEDWTQLAFVQLRGRASLLETGPEHEEALVWLRAKYEQYVPMDLDDAPIIRLEVESHVVWQAAG
jgi:coenzyme F420-0:L-glutamate ligase/coenzyme F420-1:gamma-L-glutamate ligase